jgi:hypothetical protein
MAYDFGNSGLVGYSQGDEEDLNPITGVANLADVMLVFACGLMLSLVSYWNLDLPTVSELNSSQMHEVSDVQDMQNDITSSNSAYSEVGTVYEDPHTGKLYVMRQSSDDTSNSGGSNTDAGSSSTDGLQDSAASETSSTGGSTESAS